MLLLTVSAYLATVGPAPLPAREVAGGALLALALGVRVPQRFAIGIGGLARRARGGDSEPSVHRATAGVSIPPHVVERPLYWLVLAVLSVAAGMLTVAMPALISTVTALRSTLLAGFLWSAIPLAILDVLTSFIIVAAPFMFLGTALSCTHHLCCPRAEWDERAAVWCLIGAAGGTLLGCLLLRVLVPAGGIVASALPALATALIAAFLGSSDQPAARRQRAAESCAPSWSDRRPLLLRSAIACIAGTAACTFSIWPSMMLADPQLCGVFMALTLASLACGLTLGLGERSATVGGFGIACVGAGLIVAIGAPAPAGGAEPLSVAAACLGSAAIGYAMSYGQQALLVRVASRSAAGAMELAAMLACAGAGVLAAGPLARWAFGQAGSLCMIGLSLVTLGGTLTIYEGEQTHTASMARSGLATGSRVIMRACRRMFRAVRRTGEWSAT